MGHGKRPRRHRHRNRNETRRAVRNGSHVIITAESTSPGRDEKIHFKATRGIRWSLQRFMDCEEGGGI